MKGIRFSLVWWQTNQQCTALEDIMGYGTKECFPHRDEGF